MRKIKDLKKSAQDAAEQLGLPPDAPWIDLVRELNASMRHCDISRLTGVGQSQIHNFAKKISGSESSYDSRMPHGKFIIIFKSGFELSGSILNKNDAVNACDLIDSSMNEVISFRSRDISIHSTDSKMYKNLNSLIRTVLHGTYLNNTESDDEYHRFNCSSSSLRIDVPGGRIQMSPRHKHSLYIEVIDAITEIYYN